MEEGKHHMMLHSCQIRILQLQPQHSRASSTGQVCAAVVESVFCQLLLFFRCFLIFIP